MSRREVKLLPRGVGDVCALQQHLWHLRVTPGGRLEHLR